MEERKEKKLSDYLKEHADMFNESTVKGVEESKVPDYNKEDDRFVSFKVDETGMGFANVRFMPSGGMEQGIKHGKIDNYVKIFFHFFQMDNGGWFVENCPTTWKKPCPVCEDIKPLWKGSEADKQIAYMKVKKCKYVCNIYIEKYPLEKEYEGGVFLWKVPAVVIDKIMKRIPDKTKGEKFGDINSAGEVLFNPFYPFGSFVFKIQMKQEMKPISGQKRKMMNYSDSRFLDAVGIEESKMKDEIYEKAYKNCIDLQDILEEHLNQTKSYKELSEIYKSGMSEIDFGDEDIKESEKNIKNAFSDNQETGDGNIDNVGTSDIDDIMESDNKAGLDVEEMFEEEGEGE